MDDLDIDRELRHALQVTPSPEFVARVRIKIADAPRPSIWVGVLQPAAAVASVAVVVIAAVMWKGGAHLQPSSKEILVTMADVKVSTTNSASTTNANRTPGPTKMTPAIVAPVVRPSDVDEPGSAHTVIAEPPLPEVIIAQDDIRALHEFVNATNELRFVASFDVTPAPIPWAVPETLDSRN